MRVLEFAAVSVLTEIWVENPTLPATFFSHEFIDLNSPTSEDTLGESHTSFQQFRRPTVTGTFSAFLGATTSFPRVVSSTPSAFEFESPTTMVGSNQQLMRLHTIRKWPGLVRNLQTFQAATEFTASVNVVSCILSQKIFPRRGGE